MLILFLALFHIVKSNDSRKIVRRNLGFPTRRDSATFRDNGTEVPSLSRDKGTAKIRDGTGRDSKNPGRDAGQNGTEQKRMF